jgi:uncharacterized protein YdeI (YjbR/CyaY-like superfamily)
MLLFTPRRLGSNGSRVNEERVERLTGAGLMEPASLAAVAAAKANGSWSAFDGVADLVVPDALRRCRVIAGVQITGSRTTPPG